MSIFSKKSVETLSPREITLQYLRQIPKSECEKVWKINEVQRKCDEDVAIIEAGSKRAYREKSKDDAEDQEIDGVLDELRDADLK